MRKEEGKLAVEIAAARPRVIAALAAQLRDLEAAEDAFAEACESYLLKQVHADRPAAWLFTAAKRKALDAKRRQEVQERTASGAVLVNDMADAIQLPEAIPDERLRLIFICCHPAIALEARTALALKVICGLPVADIARVFVASESAMFARITRAKGKIKQAGIAFELPHRRMWGERLEAVLLTLELAYTIAYQDAAGDGNRELSGEVARLAAMLAELLPQEAEVLGLAALVTLAKSREDARVDERGAMVPLSQQDIAKWDLEAIEQARKWLHKALSRASPGPYQTMAAIQLTHARRAYDETTDWDAIIRLYDALTLMRPGAVIALNRAVALAKVQGAEAGLVAVDAIDGDELGSLRPYHAARAELLIQLGRVEEAREALQAALALDPPSAERLLLKRKFAAIREY